MADHPCFDTDIVVAGAGVVGLAIARKCALTGRDVLLVEQANAIGTVTSARNSEVIHAGIYYPAGSLKAACCTHGRRSLYDYLRAHNLPFRQCGKIIVATDMAEAEQLASIAARAEVNGVEGMGTLDKADMKRLEPALRGEAGLLSETTGIIDSHAYMLSLLGEAEDHGAALALETQIVGGECLPDGRTRLECAGKEPCTLIANVFINAAGLDAPALAGRIDGLDQSHVPTPHLAKGSYFTLAGRAPFERLIYPVPAKAGLGVHLTLDLGGQARFGPDVEWVQTRDYEVQRSRCDGFYDAIRKYWPDLKNGTLEPAYSGIRPKIVGPDEPNADFVISGPDDHGSAGQIHLFGIESPGLTSSLALAEHVVEKMA
ncbi:MAG: NAD(P)/FAD-dependent oxidoreductase [Hyphomonadaceae bacterium]